MKVYWLMPADGQPWLSLPEVVERWRAAFPAVTAVREAARVLGEQFIAKYQQLLVAGQGRNPTLLAGVQRRWSGAVAVEVKMAADGSAAFQAVVCTEYRVQLQFGPAVEARPSGRGRASVRLPGRSQRRGLTVRCPTGIFGLPG